MKKLISYLITAMMVVTMIPSIAFAEIIGEQHISEGDTVHIEQRNPLYSNGNSEPLIEVIEPNAVTSDISPNGVNASKAASTIEEAAEILRARMVARNLSAAINIPVTESDLTKEKMYELTSDIFNSAIKHTGRVNEGDSLKWVCENWITDITLIEDEFGLTANITYELEYYTTAEQETELTEAVEELKADLDLNGKTDYEKVKAIYDYMTANISYDYANYNDDEYMLKYTAYAALVNETSVCQGYATLFYRLACEYGIDSRVIGGKSINEEGNEEGHSWNIVKLDGKYYYVDATWDAGLRQYNYFLNGTDNFENHTSDAEFTTEEFNIAYPVSKDDYKINDDQGGSDEPETPVIPESPDQPGENIGLWTDYAAKNFASGSGTETKPYIIETPEQLALLAKYANEGKEKYKKAHYILDADIDLSAHEWVPIVSRYQYGGIMEIDGFQGVFNGNNHKISNMRIVTVKEYSYYGLFGELDSATIKNLIMENPVISLDSNKAGWESQVGWAESITAGAVFGYGCGKIFNVKVNNVDLDITAKMLVTCGGVSGDTYGSRLENIEVTGSIKGKSNTGMLIGGVVGDLWNTNTEGCSFKGTVSADHGVNTGGDHAMQAGGFSGRIGGEHSYVKNCFVVAEVLTKSLYYSMHYGVFAGEFSITNGYLENVYSKGKVVATIGEDVQYSTEFTNEVYWYYNESDVKNCISVLDNIIEVKSGVNDNIETEYYELGENSYHKIFADILGFDETIWTISDKELPTLVPRVAHDWTYYKTIKEATCEEPGVKSRYCKVCNEQQTTEIKPLGHTFIDCNIIKRPTTTEEGTKRRICDVCSGTQDEPIPMLEAGTPENVVVAGVCGDMNWAIYEDGLMTINGNGDFEKISSGPFVEDKNGNEYLLPDLKVNWIDYHKLIKKVKIQISGCDNLAWLFGEGDYAHYSYYPNLTEVDFTGSETSNVKSFDGMFYSRESLETVKMDDLDTSSLCDMSSMFYYCKSLKNIHLNGWNTENVTDATHMFSGCDSLEYIEDVEQFNLENVKSITNFFIDCTNLKDLDLSAWGCDNTYSANGVFVRCNNLERVALPDGITGMDNHMFSECPKLKTIVIPASVGTIVEETIYGCRNLDEILFRGTEEQWNAIEIGPNNEKLEKVKKQYNYAGCVTGAFHTYSDWNIDRPATCGKEGLRYKICECGDKIEEIILATGNHKYNDWEVTQVATLSEAGKEAKACENCDSILTRDIPKVKSISRTSATLTYDGSKKTPVVVKDANGKILEAGTDYAVQYLTNCKNVGAHKLKVVLMGKYSDEETISFTINPKATTISKLAKPAKKQIKVTWKKQTAQVTGYQLRYSTKANMNGATTLKVTSFKTNTKTIKNLKAKKRYYVQIRTYKTVNGRAYYSTWSKAKSIITK